MSTTPKSKKPSLDRMAKRYSAMIDELTQLASDYGADHDENPRFLAKRQVALLRAAALLVEGV